MKKNFLIILIFFLALFLRIYKLGNYPVGFLWDEAALGYNAYSILKTGRDEYGTFLPLIFKSFGDYKPGLYVYLTIPSVAIFGLNEFAVRFPSALLGSLTIVMMYFLVKASSGFTRIGERINREMIALITSLLLSISPWHINFSRGAWELNVMLFELVLGFYLLLKYFSVKKITWFYLSALTFILSLFTYQAAKFLVPVLLLGFGFFFRNKFGQSKKTEVRKFIVIFLTGFALFNFLTFFGNKTGRIRTMSIFSYPRLANERQMILNQDNGNEFSYSIFHSEPVFFLRSILGRYFNHFSGRFLFFDGDWSNPRNGTVYQGVLYYADFLFLTLGLATLFGKKRESLENFMIFWLLVAPLPSALTRDSISSVRSYTMVVPIIFIIAMGLTGLVNFLQKNKPIIQFSLFIIIIFTYLFFFIRFLDLFFIHDPKFNSKDRLYGYREVFDYIIPLIFKKDKVIFTQKYGQPYIFYLFYSKYNPKNYQRQAKLKENPYGDVGEVERIDNIEFRKIYWPEDRGIKNALFIGDEFELPLQDVVGQEGISLLEEIKFLNRNTAFRIVETR